MSKGIVKEIDKGFYEEARQKNIHPLTMLTQLVNPEPPEIEKIAERMLARCGWKWAGAECERVARSSLAVAMKEPRLAWMW